MNQVFFYHEPITEYGSERLLFWEESRRIVVESWRKAGWIPHVLNESHARQHSKYKIFKIAVQEIPTVNGPQYHWAIYARWLAFAQQGGGLWADTDCLNLGFTPGHLRVAVGNKPGDPLVFSEPAVAMVYAPKKFCEHFVECTITYRGPWIKIGPQLHWCDMHMLQKLQRDEHIRTVKILDNFYDNYFDKMIWPLVGHFAASSTPGNLTKRLQKLQRAYKLFWG